MGSDLLRWLHISDLHLGRDDYAQRKFCEYLISAAEQRLSDGIGPDLVFITGDVANTGHLDQYEMYYDLLIAPMAQRVLGGDVQRILTVPGNHDVDRAQAPHLATHGLPKTVDQILDPTEHGLSLRKELCGRFQHFASTDCTYDRTPHWLMSSNGCLVKTFKIRDLSIGVIGLNTAWFSINDQDRNQLSPGKNILEDAIDITESCDIKIVLGHHPLGWFSDKEKPAISAMLARAGAIYLHGHMHITRHACDLLGAGECLTIQTGSLYQEREGASCPNRILWCAADPAGCQILAEPRAWSKDHQEWCIDGEAFTDDFWSQADGHWSLPMPKGTSHRSSPSVAPKGEDFTIPGWKLIDRPYLDANRADLNDEQILQYFDGKVPTWREAMSIHVPRRSIVSELAASVNGALNHDGPSVTVLLGAGGEGKSTALRQVVCNITDSEAGWNVLWHQDVDSPLETSHNIPQSGNPWLVVSDDADLVLNDVFRYGRGLHEESRKDVHFLLSARDTDWIAAGGNRLPWRLSCRYKEYTLSGLNSEDAEKIVTAWSVFGNRGLGTLSSLDIEDAADKLVELAQEHSYAQEGAFLGAMLQARFGEGLRDHVRLLLSRLQHIPCPGGCLLDAFAYVAVTHCYDDPPVTKQILANALGCSPKDVRKSIIGPLGDEAAAVSSGQSILTRHRVIASAAASLLEKEFFVDVDELYASLVEAVLDLMRRGERIADWQRWCLLPEVIVRRGRSEVAVRIADMCCRLRPADSRMRVQLARVLRQCGRKGEAVDVFRIAPEPSRPSCQYFHEWATCELVEGQWQAAAYLFAVAVSDHPRGGAGWNSFTGTCLATIALELSRRASDSSS